MFAAKGLGEVEATVPFGLKASGEFLGGKGRKVVAFFVLTRRADVRVPSMKVSTPVARCLGGILPIVCAWHVGVDVHASVFRFEFQGIEWGVRFWLIRRRSDVFLLLLLL